MLHRIISRARALVRHRRRPFGSFVSGGHADEAGHRDYRLYVPPRSHGRARPLVVMLHGCKQDPEDFAAGTRMNELARAQRFFVLYPAQATGNHPWRCWQWYLPVHQRRESGEPALLAGMTRAVMGRHGIDPARVYVAGLSAGGAMAAILGQTHADLFAAVGVHSGLPRGAASHGPGALSAMKRGNPVLAPGVASTRRPWIVFHGDADDTVHPANGDQVLTAGFGTEEPVRVDETRHTQGRPWTRRIYRGARGEAMAEHWVIHGGGHAWSGGSVQGSCTEEQGPDATREMVRFFLQTSQHVSVVARFMAACSSAWSHLMRLGRPARLFGQ